MNRFLHLFILFLASQFSTLAQSGGLASFSPASPRWSDRISVRYNAGHPNALLQGVKAITCEALVMRSGIFSPVLLEMPMKLDRDTWSCEFNLKDSTAILILYHFISGDTTDDNGGNGWISHVCDDEGMPVKGSHLEAYWRYLQGGFLGFRCRADSTRIREELNLERKFHPTNLAVRASEWRLLIKDHSDSGTKELIKRELDSLGEIYRTDSQILDMLIDGYGMINEMANAEELRKYVLSTFPNSFAAGNVRMGEIYAARNASERIPRLEKLFKEFPVLMGGGILGWLIDSYIELDQHDKAAALLDANPDSDGEFYDAIARDLIQKGKRIDQALKWSRKGITAIRMELPSESPPRTDEGTLSNPTNAHRGKPPFMSWRQWVEDRDTTLGSMLGTYARGLMHLRKTREAEKYFAEAYERSKGENALINEGYIACLLLNRRKEQALETGVACARKGAIDDEFIDRFGKAFVHVRGGDRFGTAVEEGRKTAHERMRKEIVAEQIDTPAPDFTLIDCNGTKVRLADLKGNVVVLDFWATWCGPCSASFPAMQKVYDAFKSYDNVSFYALDCWEKEKGSKREELVRKYIADHMIGIPVLYDEGFAERYGISGIPAKIVIDARGNIRFKSYGFFGERKLIDELTAKIELLLDEISPSAK